MFQVEVVNNEVVGLPRSRGKGLVELRVHLVAGEGERVWADCRMKISPACGK